MEAFAYGRWRCWAPAVTVGKSVQHGESPGLSMKRKKPAPTRSSREVETAIRKLREFHDIGHHSLKNMPENRGYGRSVAKAEADELGMNEDTLRKARQFADLYSDDDLGELVSLCRQHEFALSRTYIIQLVRVPVKDQRRRLQEKVIAERWKTTRLRQAIASRYGPRRAATGDTG